MRARRCEHMPSDSGLAVIVVVGFVVVMAAIVDARAPAPMRELQRRSNLLRVAPSNRHRKADCPMRRARTESRDIEPTPTPAVASPRVIGCIRRCAHGLAEETRSCSAGERRETSQDGGVPWQKRRDRIWPTQIGR